MLSFDKIDAVTLRTSFNVEATITKVMNIKLRQIEINIQLKVAGGLLGPLSASVLTSFSIEKT